MGEIKLENVGLINKEVQILKGISEVIYDGELYCIMGTSGSGKSSLLKIINGLFIEIEGNVIVEGKNIYHYSPKEMLDYHQRSGFIFQNAALLNNMTIYENLGLYFQYHTKVTQIEIYEKIEEYLHLFEIDATLLDHRPGSLSSGEKVIFGIIRALIQEPNYYFWDQPLAVLDHINQERVKKIIKKENKKGRTSILVTNDTKFGLKIADRIGILHGGRLVASDTPARIRKSNDLIVKQLIRN